jgi:chemotaxis protein methyltransferase CheR
VRRRSDREGPTDPPVDDGPDPAPRLPALLLDDVARVLAVQAGVSLRGGLDLRLVDGLDGAARAAGEPVRAFARRVAAGDAAAVARLVEHVVVAETAFWRHPEQLAAVGRIAGRARGPMSIWSAGCATGEEAYSVAIALLEAGRGGRGDRILATDVSRRALAVAQDGVYGARAVRKLPHAHAVRWREGTTTRRVKDAVRALVRFASHNLVAPEPAPGGPFDVVLCRNVLIYFDRPTAAAVVRRLANALAPGGTLVLGPVEGVLGEEIGLDPVEEAGATVLRRPAGGG